METLAYMREFSYSEDSRRMKSPDYVIVLPDGKRYITTTIAALMLSVHRRRIDQFIEAGAFSTKMLPHSKTRIIPLKEFRAFAKKPRAPGRPPNRKAAKKATKKGKK